MMRLRRLRPVPPYRSVAAYAFLGLVLGGASVASACVPQPNLVVVQPRSSGPPGTEVTVEAVGLDAGPAEVRWNSAGGPLLAEARGPSFSVPVRVPDASPGLYAVVVLSRQPGGGIGNTGTVAFQVTGSGTERGVAPTPAEDAGATSTTVARTLTSSRSAGSMVLAFGAGAGLATLGVLLLARLRRE